MRSADLRLRVAKVLVVLGSLGLFALLSEASAASHLEVVATGLDNPRGLAFSPTGDLYVVEAGRGGDGPCTAGRRNEICYGATGAVTRVHGQHGQERVVTGLPSIGNSRASPTLSTWSSMTPAISTSSRSLVSPC